MLLNAFNSTSYSVFILIITKGCLLKAKLYIYEFLLATMLLTSQVISFYLILFWIYTVSILGTRRFFGSLLKYQLHRYIFRIS